MRVTANRLLETYLALVRESASRRAWEQAFLGAEHATHARRFGELVQALRDVVDLEFTLAVSASMPEFVGSASHQVAARADAAERTRAIVELAQLLESLAGPIELAVGLDEVDRLDIANELTGLADSTQAAVFSYIREMIGVECDPEEPIVLVATAPRDRPTDVIRGRDGRRVPFIDVSQLRGMELFEAACELLVDAAEAGRSSAADGPAESAPRQVGLNLPAGLVDSTFTSHSHAGSPWQEVADRVDATGDQRAALCQGLRILMVASCVSEAIRRTASPSYQSAAESLGVYVVFDPLWQAIRPAWSMYLAGLLPSSTAIDLMSDELAGMAVTDALRRPDAAMMAADFYLLEYLSAHGDVGGSVAFARYCHDAERFMSEVVTITVGAELGHIVDRYHLLGDTPEGKFLAGLGCCDTRISWARALRADEGEALRNAERCFGGPFVDFDGIRWVPIASTLREYREGQLSGPAFIDWCFSVRHNSGPIFDKFCRVDAIEVVLDAQSQGDVSALARFASKRVADLLASSSLPDAQGDSCAEQLDALIRAVSTGDLTPAQAIGAMAPTTVEALLNQSARPTGTVLGRGLAASPHVVAGPLATDAATVESYAARGTRAVLMADVVDAANMHAALAAGGLVVRTGGVTSHGAVLARAHGIACVVSVTDLHVAGAGVKIGGHELRIGDTVVVDGQRGEIVLPDDIVPVQLKAPVVPGLSTLLGWADQYRTLSVRANADTSAEARAALSLGAVGIGLCRTEHFMLGPHARDVAALFAARTSAERRSAALRLMPRHRSVVRDLAQVMDGKPLLIRLLDAPSHEFASQSDASFAEANPMMGLRGVRMGIVMPEVYQAQVRAIFDGAADAADEGAAPQIEIAVPMIASASEFRIVRDLIERTWHAAQRRRPSPVTVRVGAVIEVPRGAIRCRAVAALADFLSFGTNDLAQFAWGLSRDDADSRIIPEYLNHKVFASSPFASLDAGVGALVAHAVREARDVSRKIEIGVCGEAASTPGSLALLAEAGVDYISCSPPRLQAARIFAGQLAAR
jgi:phosphoenolpyruvate-protein kinase (PTS system EI component)